MHAPSPAMPAPPVAGAPQAPGVLGWPQQVPLEPAYMLVDAEMALAFERGPREWWQGWQRQRLAAMLAWLAQGEAWRRWLAPASGAHEIHEFPVMRRPDYRALVESGPPRVPPEFGQLMQGSTSGSTGVPVKFWQSALGARVSRGIFWADNQRQGRDLRKTSAVIVGNPSPPTVAHDEGPGNAWLHPGRDLLRHSNFDAQSHAQWLCDQAPPYFAIYPTLLSGILSVFETSGLRAPRLEQVMTFGEVVEPELRARALQVLGARIVDRYSCEEVGPMAFECARSPEHQHVAVSNVILEVVDDAGRPLPAGEPGNVLVTGLNQWASPALRYELGDVASLWPQCPVCGAAVPTLTALLGRKRSLVRRTDGSLVYLRIVASDWLACAPVREHRLVQVDPQHFRIELVVAHPLTAAEREAIDRMLRRRIGEQFDFEVVQVDAIAWPPGRKRQETLGLFSQVAPP